MKIYYFLLSFLLFFQLSWASDLIQLTALVEQAFTQDSKSWSHRINESGDYQIGEAWIEASQGSDVTLKIYKNDKELLKSIKAPEGELMFFESRVDDLFTGDQLTIQISPNGGTYRMGYKIASATPDFKGLAVFNVHDIAYGAVGDGSTDDFAAIQATVNAAIQVGGGIVRFDGSKVYRAIGSKSLDIEKLIDIKNGKNIKIEGNGATILLHPPDRLVSIKQSENIQIDGLVMNYDPIPYYQGKIDNINIKNKTIDITVPNRYEVPKVGDSPAKNNSFFGFSNNFFAFSFMPNSPDARLGKGKHIYISKTETINGDPRKVRLSVKDQSLKSLQYSIDHNATEMVVPDIDYGHRGVFSIEVHESSRVTVSNLLCKMMPHLGIQPENNVGPITFTNVDLLMENPETELFWSWRGAYSVTGNNRWGFLIEDGEWHGNAMYDDMLAFYTRRQEVLKITGYSLSLDPGVYTDFLNLYKVGDWVSIWTKDQEILRGFSRVVSLGEKHSKSFDICFESLPEGVSIDDVVINESLYNRGTVVRNCKNIPVGASDATTRIRTGGYFKDCDFNGLYLITEFQEVYKPVRCRNLIVENCVFGQTENNRVRLTSSINPRFINCTFDNTYIYGDMKARDIYLQNSTWVNMDDEVISLSNSKVRDKNNVWVFGGATRNGISENLSNYIKIEGNSTVNFAMPLSVNGYYPFIKKSDKH
jgi:hypothetical protein